ncbi:MAG: Uma2 family endonuclease [Pseudonocardia sp.]
MTEEVHVMAQPLPDADIAAAQPRLLTIAEYLAIGEVEPGYTELFEGRVVRVPSPQARHNRAGYRIAGALEPQLPAHLEVILDVDVDLELARPEDFGFSRRPDFIVVHKSAVSRQGTEGGMLRAPDVVIIGEIVSFGSKRTDYVMKRGEYADAGIPYYWIVDLREPVSLLACHQAGEFGYADSGEITGTFTAADPFPLTLDLDSLL